MVVAGPNINNIMSGIENTGGVKQNNKKKLRQRFDIIRKLGQGTFGKVQLGINKETGQEVAIKTIKKSKIESEADLVRIRREIQIMSSVQHPNIIHIYEVFENKEKMVLVMEYAAGGELYDYLSERKVLTEDEARRIFRQIATACYYCHKHKICHRDLKLENILLDENNNAKIADFGLSNVFDDQRLLNTFCGSPLYASPEIVKGTPYHGPEVDCWSLGVLLYTLVYGAMPFDGSNFKVLVRQISHGDYFEPASPSPASPLIREMLTVNPKNRADIEKICTHWWVNETYDDSCLDISEELANQTPVRLDVLLSLAPPAPQLECEKLVVTGDVCEEAAKLDSGAPARSQSVGSIMDLTPAEKRRIDLMNEEKISPKRKLESTISSNKVNQDKGVTRKEKIIKDNTVADITVCGAIKEASVEDASMTEALPLNKSLTQTISREMDVEQTEEIIDPTLQGAACSELIEESQKKESKKQPKVKKTLSTSVNNQALENINENPSQTLENHIDKENVKSEIVKDKEEDKPKLGTKTGVKKKVEKKKILTDKDENSKSTSESQPTNELKKVVKNDKKTDGEDKPEENITKPVERRKSRTFEAAEKFQNMISGSEAKPAPVEKPKKILIPGVSVDGFKKEYERKASLTSTSPPKLKSEPPTKKIIEVETQSQEPESVPKTESKPETKKTDERIEAVRNAVNIISSALDKEGTRKSKSRPCMMRKPPVPFGASGRSASGNIGMLTSQLSPPLGPKPFVKTLFDKPIPTEAKQVQDEPEPVEENKVSSAEITLKSATLPRRKTAKAEIQLNYPMPKPATMEFKTEMAHNVAAAPKNVTQRSEVIVPVSSPSVVGFKTSSADPESKKSKERIIPIAFDKAAENRESVQSPPPKPPMNRNFQTQKSNQSQRSGSISRQSTQESDTDTVTSTGEPIKKSPREYIIPIAVEGGGYVTPRAGSLEPSEVGSTSTMSSKSRFGRAKRLNSRLSDRDSEDESPFTNLHRHSSFGKDSDTEETRNPFHFHRLRSTRPKKSTLEHTDSLSSGEEDDDEGFDNFTAENLFSTLLSRVRELTQRLNVEDGVRPGFPTSRLLSQFNHGTNFFNRQDPFLSSQYTVVYRREIKKIKHSSLSRTFSRERPDNNSTTSFGGTPWRRSVSRDLTSDIDSVFNDPNSMSSRPRGDISKNESLNLSDLDLKKLKLSDEDALALSYLTPALSKRIQKQILAQLAPSEAKKLHRTLSSQSSTSDNPYDNAKDSQKYIRRSVDRLCSTLPRRFSIDRDNKVNNLSNINERENANVETGFKNNRSFLPVKSFTRDRTPYHEFTVRSSSIGAEPRCDSKFLYNRKPTFGRSSSVREPRAYLCRNDPSPDSSISESISRNDDSSSYKKDTDSISDLSSNTSRSYSRFSSDPYKLSSNRITSNPSQTNNSTTDLSKSDIKKPSTASRRISRFLRPDFYDGQKDEKDNVVLKEKKEKELETQKVLKEIRDKRKSRLNMRRERSLSKDRQIENTLTTPDIHAEVNKFLEIKNKSDVNVSNGVIINGHSNTETNESLDSRNGNMSHDYVNIKDCNQNDVQIENVAPINQFPDYVNVESNTITNNSPFEQTPCENTNENIIHDYVNVKVPEVVTKKERVSKIARPKSYPAEKHKEIIDAVAPEKEKEKESKISRLKKGFVRQSSKEKEDKAEKSNTEEEKTSKNKLLQSIEKKLEKFRSSNIAANKDPEEVKVLQEKKSSVENAIKRLREQSLPRNIEHCTESGLIKRAVSVEEMPNNKPLQASRKSVTKILGLFKKYEEQDSKKKEKLVKKSKSGDKEKRDKTNTKNIENKIDNKDIKQPNETVIVHNSNTTTKVNSNSTDNNNGIVNGNDSSQSEDLSLNMEKKERPRSLMFERNKNFQTAYNGARSDTAFTNEKGKSKLPVNNYRRSLNLDNLPEPPKFYKNPTIKMSNDSENNNLERPTRESLKLDFTKLPGHSQSAAVLDSYPSTAHSEFYRNHYRDKRNSLNTPDDNSAFLSPGDDNASCDSWSVCSDLHTHELHSPLSPNGHIYSGDEGESVIDRIRRKSFYTRFNEKKRPRIPSFTRNYKDLDVYNKDSSIKSPTDYSSLDRRNFRNPVNRRSSYGSSIQDPVKPEYKTYQRSSSLLNDYVNVPNRYQTYSSKIGRPTTSLYSDSEDNTLDDYLSTAKSRKYSSPLQTSRLTRASPSPRYSVDRTPSSITSPTTSEPA